MMLFFRSLKVSVLAGCLSFHSFGAGFWCVFWAKMMEFYSFMLENEEEVDDMEAADALDVKII